MLGEVAYLVLGPLVQRNSVDNNNDLKHHSVSKLDERDKAAHRRKKHGQKNVFSEE
jgi:hypothetical protein